ncbi:hypothetical protein PQO03_18910 [Lentisphaera profundi]|uniref:Aldose 1-epimerase n=1 Tax=Lentisphaera profundi TaxID=1658616 RepID=A0ABY7VXG8_9BACT|nr:hypothetical protein [Lentisphaera profundi]WDE97900.1 hypothetical protein PQO03_18910 [Lentisphaera profundi]
MFQLKNNKFTVEILDPKQDQDLLGARYCRGGQIFQVKNSEGRDLFSGPVYPEDYNPFDSQGLPDAFNSYPNLEGAELGDDIFVIGVGLVKYSDPIVNFFACENREVKKALEWKITQNDNQIIFTCTDSYDAWSYELVKTVELKEGKLEQRFSLKNCGDKILPVSWFAHPFFFHREDGLIGKLPVKLEANDNYTLNKKNELLTQIPQDFDPVKHNTFAMGKANQKSTSLNLPIQHKVLDDFSIDCHFKVAQLPLWYNEKTISPEPFLIQDLGLAEQLDWGITYNLS